MYAYTFIGILLPFVGTVLGASLVFFMKKELGDHTEKILSGFAAGVMIAASVWSLLIPAMEYESSLLLGNFAFLPAILGLWSGILFLIFAQRFTKKIDENELFKRSKRTFGENAMLFWAVSLHNLPEGMAVGVVFAAFIASPTIETLGTAIVLSFGIAIQNIPEGAIISMPLHAGGTSKRRSFFVGAVSGAIEPIGAALTVVAISVILPTLPFLLGFAAGAMIYAVINELIPRLDTKTGIISFATGFSVMMILDVMLG